MKLSDLLPDFVFLPSQPFLMGTPERELGALAKTYGGTRESYREESPQHRLYLPPFAIADTPVTNALYAIYVADAGARLPLIWRGATPPDHLRNCPVTDVSWKDAQQFCRWLSNLMAAPYRLPTEAEWEYAARGSDGRRFPWGDEWDPTRANTRDGGPGVVTPVGAYPSGASPWGCLDMAGNVWEWTASLDAPYPYRFDSGLFAILLLAAMRPSEPPLKRRFLERDKRLSAFGALSPLITRAPFSHTEKGGRQPAFLVRLVVIPKSYLFRAERSRLWNSCLHPDCASFDRGLIV